MEGIKHLQPLLDLWDRGKNEGVIKPYSDYLLYGFAINPLAFLMMAQKQYGIILDEHEIDNAFLAAWNSIKQ
jgi:hypothetical protein